MLCRAAVALVLLAGLTAGTAWIAASLVMKRADLGLLEDLRPAHGIEDEAFRSPDGVPLRGWWWPGKDRRRAVLLLHGFRANRLQMFPRAKWLHQVGYSVFLFDFRGSGASGGRSTLGFSERLDVEAALDLLWKKKAIREVAIIAQSMGAAAAVMAVDRWQGVRGADLEHLYDRLDSAVRGRVRDRAGGLLEPILSPLVLWQVRPRMGFSPEQLAPVEKIGRARCPILLGFGGQDETLSPAAVRELFQKAPYPTTLWVIQSAGHTDLFRCNPEFYRKKVGDFLQQTLGSPAEESKE